MLSIFKLESLRVIEFEHWGLNFNLWDPIKGLLVSIQNHTEFAKEWPRKCILMKIYLNLILNLNCNFI